MPTINTKSAKTYSSLRSPRISNKSPEGDSLSIRQKIYQSTTWHSLRKSYLQEHPCCEVHLLAGLVIPAEHVHHKYSFMLGKDPETKLSLAYNYGNLISLCSKCHNHLHGILSSTSEGTSTGQDAIAIYNILNNYYKKHNLPTLPPIKEDGILF